MFNNNNNHVLAVHAIPVIVQEEPNNVITTSNNITAATSSRPSSQLSQNGSSGYGSTRSQVGPFGVSNRPSPSSASTASESSNDLKKAVNKRSVWFGSLRRGGRNRAAAPCDDLESMVVEVDEAMIAQTRGQPQFASLRIPNRIRHLSESFEADRGGLDLAEAEVDSDVEDVVNMRPPVPAPRRSGSSPPPYYRNDDAVQNYPLRHALSLEAQVCFFEFFEFFQRFWLVPCN